MSVDRSRPTAAMPVNAFRIRGTAFRMPETSGDSMVGRTLSGVARTTGGGVGVKVGVSVEVGGSGVGEGVRA